MMKISEFLKNQGLFSNEIKDRFKNGQIKINGEVIKTDIELDINDPTPDPRFKENLKPPTKPVSGYTLIGLPNYQKRKRIFCSSLQHCLTLKLSFLVDVR